ncbi:MAG: polysaccharide biosynthesis protein, partial [Pseudomonadota bacterium]
VHWVIGRFHHPEWFEKIIQKYEINTVIHAGLFQNPELAEENVLAAIEGNFETTRCLSETAKQQKIKTFLLISSYQAVRPSEVYGATLRMSELWIQSLAKSDSTTTFAVVRSPRLISASDAIIANRTADCIFHRSLKLSINNKKYCYVSKNTFCHMVIHSLLQAASGDLLLIDPSAIIAIQDLETLIANHLGYSIDYSDGQINDNRLNEALLDEDVETDNVMSTNQAGLLRTQEFTLSMRRMQEWVDQLVIACTTANLPEVRKILEAGHLGYGTQSEWTDPLWEVQESSNVVPIHRKRH